MVIGLLLGIIGVLGFYESVPVHAQGTPNSPATGAPTISGTAQEGETLTVSTTGIADADGLNNVSYSYQWIRNDGTGDTDIADATGSNYALVAADAGKTIKVKVSFTDDAGHAESVTSAATTNVAPENNLATGVPLISGVAREGETLTVDASGISDVDGMENAQLNYYWYSEGEWYGGIWYEGTEWIGGSGYPSNFIHYSRCSNAPTCIVVPERVVGSPIRVIVYFTDDAGNTEYLTSAPTEQVTSVPGIGGHFNCQWPQVGEELYAVTWRMNDIDGMNGVSFSYQWIVNDGTGDADLAGETGSNYLPTANDVDKRLRVRVSYKDEADNPESSTSVPTWPVVPANTVATGVPVISGALRVGETLTGSTAGISDADGLLTRENPFTFIWHAIDPITGDEVQRKLTQGYLLDQDPQSYTIRDVDLGMKIRLTVSLIDDHCNWEKVFSADSEAVATGLPGINGTVRVGETLSADTSHIVDADGLTNATFSYQWVRNDGTNDTNISGATGSTYTLTADDVGKTIKVQVSFTDDASNAESLTSAATATVIEAGGNFPATGAPIISGTAQVGETLTADTSGIADADGMNNVSFSYQWVRNDGTSDTDIADATSSTYTTVTADFGTDISIKVRVSFTDDADNDESLTSALFSATTNSTPVDEVVLPVVSLQTADPNSPATGAPTISGTAQVGETLSVSTSGIADTDGLTNVAYSYQWVRNDGTSDTDIADATGSTYVLVDADEGQTLKVKVSFTDDASHAESLTSAVTATVAARPNRAATGAPTISGTAQVGETLTVSTSGIADTDGLTNVAYSYQWARNDGTNDTDIADGTASTYTLVAPDEGKTIKVKVSFTDDASHTESLTSAATATVAVPIPNKPTGLSLAVSHDVVTLTWDNPQDNAITGYVILRRDRAIHPVGTFVTIAGDTGSTDTTYTDDTVEPDKRYVYRIKAINEHGGGERDVRLPPGAPGQHPGGTAQLRGHGGPDHQRHGAGGRDLDGFDFGHRRRGRPDQRCLQLPVGA